MERGRQNLPAFTGVVSDQLQQEATHLYRDDRHVRYDLPQPSNGSQDSRGRNNAFYEVPVSREESPTPSEDAPLLGASCRDFEASGHHLARTDEKVSSLKALIHLIKGNLGTGILAIPDAVKHAGLYGGLVYLPMLAAICMHCMHLLVDSVAELKKRTARVNFDYAKAGEYCLRCGPIDSRKLGRMFGVIINVFLTLTQIGFCVVYVIFLAANLKNLVDDLWPQFGMEYNFYIGIAGVAICFSALFKDLKMLVIPSLVSNVCIVSGLVTLLCGYLFVDLASVNDRTWFAPATELPLFLATAIYAFEGIGTVLPVHKSMEEPEEFTTWTGVLNTAMSSVTIGYMSIGFYGYLKYGDLVEGSVTLNIPQTEPLAISINVLFMIAIYLTYPLMLYVPVEILKPVVLAYFPERPAWHGALSWALRYSLVLLTIGLAAAIPRIDLAISFVGSFASSTLAIIFPPFIHTLVFWDASSWLSKAKNILIMLFGVFCMVMGTLSSVAAIVDAL